MKRITSILLILIIVCSAFTVMNISVFAEEGATQDEAAAGGIDGILDMLGQFIPMETINNLKETVFGPINDLWDRVMSNETYKNIFTAILGVLGFLLIPIIFALAFIAYTIMAASIICAGALVALLEVILTILVGLIPGLIM